MTDLIDPKYDYSSAFRHISSIGKYQKAKRPWYLGFAVSAALLFLFLVAVTYLFAVGVGIWGLKIPVAWAFDITNFVWWVGIGHAGTFISAILFLFRQKWRNSINRFAEAMTLFAVICAAMFPLIHLGRPWLFYWFFPYPNTMDLYPQYRSPLVWDFVAIASYFSVSALFWYLGLIPDLATLRDHGPGRRSRKIYGILSLGWRGSSRHWHQYEMAYLLLAGLATPLVISVHTIVSFDFAATVVPGWHSAIFPPYFVAGAIFSGFAMVLILAIPLRKWYDLQGLITSKHLENCAKLLLCSGLFLVYAYFMEIFFAWYGGDEYEWFRAVDNALGGKAKFFWAMVMMNLLLPQLLWWKRARTKEIFLFSLSLIVMIGMWLERYVIIVMSLERDYLPSSWDRFRATFWDYATLLGTVGLFLFLFFLFIRYLPLISISEVGSLIHETKKKSGGT